ncbi:methyl-accepting chemotaxis protein [Evansella sp. AB-rgal1]|uniref:methyl-accepting chemotaxis protein n=1 Tax=Evansella sp. AB-rgal1 TaxID=3242696 RepID=UPI00359D0E19
MKVKLTVARKLIIGFFTVLILFGIVSVITNNEFHDIDGDYTDSIEDRGLKLRLVTNMENAVLLKQIAVRGYLVTGNEANLRNLESIREQFRINAEKYLSLTNLTDSRQMVEEYVELEGQYAEVAQKLINYSRQNNSNQVAILMREEGDALTTKITEAGDSLREFQLHQLALTSDQLSSSTSNVRNFIMGISILVFIVGTIIALYISRIIAKPVILLSDATKQISEGNLTIDDVVVKNRDEIGELAVSFNQMKNTLREVILEVNTTAENVASSAEELTASAEQTSSATNQVAISIEEVASGAELQEKNTEESANAVGEMAIGIQRVAESTSSVAESAQDTTQQASSGNSSLKKVVDQMNSINASAQETSVVIQELDKNSVEIGKIIDVITGIADQTNLLALNAAIESARAGEHGRGFAVVADEVRKLAEQSKESANQIATLIAAIQQSTSQAVVAMNRGASEVSEGMNLVEETGKNFEQILSSIEKVSSEIQEVSAVTEEMSASVEQVNASIDEVSSIAKVSAQNTSDIASASEEQLASMEEITSSASTLAEMAENMRVMISKFRI